jgi:hypothetical protein
VPGKFKSTPGDGSLRTTQDKSGSLRQRCVHLASDFKFMQRC